MAPTKPAGPEAPSNHSHTTLLHSTAYSAPATRVLPRCGRTAKDGSSQTRWCTQVIGLTRHAARPLRANAAVQSPAARARAARRAQTHRTSRTAVPHSARLGSPGAASRAGTPSKDWWET